MSHLATPLLRLGHQGLLGELAVAVGDVAEQLGVTGGVAEAPLLVIEQRLFVLSRPAAPRAGPGREVRLHLLRIDERASGITSPGRRCARATIGDHLGDVLDKLEPSKASGVGGAAQVEDAARVVAAEHGGARGANVVELARDDAARDFGVIDRRAAAEAAAHLYLWQIEHLQSSALQQARPERLNAKHVGALAEAVVRHWRANSTGELGRVRDAIHERQQVQRPRSEPLSALFQIGSSRSSRGKSCSMAIAHEAAPVTT